MLWSKALLLLQMRNLPLFQVCSYNKLEKASWDVNSYLQNISMRRKTMQENKQNQSALCLSGACAAWVSRSGEGKTELEVSPVLSWQMQVLISCHLPVLSMALWDLKPLAVFNLQNSLLILSPMLLMELFKLRFHRLLPGCRNAAWETIFQHLKQNLLAWV